MVYHSHPSFKKKNNKKNLQLVGPFLYNITHAGKPNCFCFLTNPNQWCHGELDLCLVFKRCCVDEPLSARPDDDGLLCPPVIRIAVDTLLLLHQSPTVLQHGDHWRYRRREVSRDGGVYLHVQMLPLSVPSVITARFCSSGPASSVNLASSSTIHSFGERKTTIFLSSRTEFNKLNLSKIAFQTVKGCISDSEQKHRHDGAVWLLHLHQFET